MKHTDKENTGQAVSEGNPNDANNLRKPVRSDEELARMIVRVAEAAQVDAIICLTETGAFAQHMHRLSDQMRIIAATTNQETLAMLTRAGVNWGAYHCGHRIPYSVIINGRS